MNERLRFSWGHIIAFIALIAAGYTSFVGFTYLTGGNFIFGAIGMGITVFLFILIFVGAQQLKASGVRMKKKILWERILIFGSPLVFVAGMIAMSHFWTVQAQNDRVVADFNATLNDGKGIFTDYENYAADRISNYDRSLSKIIADKNRNPALYTKAGFTPGIEQIQKDNMIEVLRLQLLSSNYDSLKNLAVSWIDYANQGASAYNVFLLGNTREISEALSGWEKDLKGFSTKKLSNEQLLYKVNDFNPNSGAAAARQIYSLGQRFTHYEIPTARAIIFGVGLYLMLIFPYLIQDRHAKSSYRLTGYRKDFTPHSSDSESFETLDDENPQSSPRSSKKRKTENAEDEFMTF